VRGRRLVLRTVCWLIPVMTSTTTARLAAS